MLEIIVKENDKGQRVDKFLGKVMQNCSKSTIYKWIRTKKIKVNRKKCEIDQRLMLDDVVQFFIPHDFVKAQKNDFMEAKETIAIFYESNELLIAWKEKGLLVHPDKSESKDTFIQRVLKYLTKTKQFDITNQASFRPATIHRLDRNTEGFIVVAKTYEALKKLNEMMKNHLIQKKYVTIVENALPQSDTLIHYHFKDKNGKVLISDRYQEGYKEMITKYRVLASFGKYHLIEIDLITGKSHQIRAQFAFIGHPLLGDKRYGSTFSADYQTLSAYQISFEYHEQIFLTKMDNSTTALFERLKKNELKA